MIKNKKRVKNIVKAIKELNIFENFCIKNKEKIVFMCVGNSKVWYDSFGPIVGSLLTNTYKIKSYVYGNCEKNITRTNLLSYINFIKTKHFNKKIIVIDSAINDSPDIKIVVFRKGGVVCAYYENNVGIGDMGILCPVKTIESETNNIKKIVSLAMTISFIISKILC